MREYYFETLSRITDEINEKNKLQSEQETRKQCSILVDEVNKILELSELARRQGLLELEERIQSIDSDDFLKMGIMLVTDGTDADIFEEIMLSWFIGEAWHDYDALKAFIDIYGMCSIQCGELPRILKLRLISMLPHDAKKIFCSSMMMRGKSLR